MTLIFGNTVTVFTNFAVGSIDGAELRSKINHYTLYFIYLFIARTGLTYISMLLFSVVATNITACLRKRYLSAVLHQSITFHETSLSSGEFSLALSTHSNSVRTALAEKFGMSLKCISTIVAAFVVALHSQWKLALVTSTVIPAAVVAISFTGAMDEKKETSLNNVKAAAATLAEELFSSIRTVRSLGAEGKLFAQYKGLLDQASAIAWSRLPIVGTQVGSYMFALYGAYALAFWYGMHLYARHETKSSGAVITALFSIMIGINAFSELATHLGTFMKLRSSGEELIKIINLERNVASRSFPGGGKGASSVAEEKCLDLFRRDILLENVSFHYPTRPKVQTLKDFSLTLQAGKTTALVGPSGCGKSTIVGLVLGWYRASAGEVRFGDCVMEDIPIETIRKNIGLVQQEPCLFTGTVFENVAYGLSGTSFEEVSESEKREMVIKACTTANAHEFVMRLPQGYDTAIGNRGTSLSGGQKQRLAISRAIIKNPPILILDEATSALDAQSEAVVQHALDNAQHNRTTISIAHRLTTIKSADQIVVMRNGSIIELGTHNSLLDTDEGIYRRLWEAQLIPALISHHSPDSDEDISTKLQVLEKPITERFVDTPGSDNEACNHPSIKLTTLLSTIFRAQRRYWWAYLLLLVGSIIGGALFPLQAYLYAKLVTTFQLTGAALVSRSNFWALMWFIVALVVAVGYFIVGGVGTGLGESIAQYYRFQYFVSLAWKPLSYFDSESNAPSAILNRLATDPENINSFAGSNLAVLVTILVSLISTITLALAVGWKLALVVIFGGLPFIFSAGVFHERMENGFEEKSAKAFEGSVGFASECVGILKTVSALNMEPLVEKRFAALLSEHCTNVARYQIVAMIWFALSESIELLCMALAFWYGGRLMSFHEYNTTQFFTVFVAIIFGSQSMGQFFAHSSDMFKGLSSARTILSQSAAPHNHTAKLPLPQLDALSSNTPLIEFRNVCFSYPTRPTIPILRNLNLKIYAGQFVALVGSSGCGKSTVLQLLERFYEVESGDILIGGVSVKNLEDSDVRKLYSLVSQEPTLYSGNVQYNTSLGVSGSLDREKLDQVLKQAQLSEFISSLPEGINTEVGARGTALSGGQKQRVAIARALAQDSAILLLDEATSALDSNSEREIQKAIINGQNGGSSEVAVKRTVIAVAHRLSTIQHSDCIFVFDQGQLVETGTHHELTEKKGVYWCLCKAQTGWIE
ncbi:P-loop containing nucleoside triphosphate hydrolase protein [Microthyrium microscopicum]|uniref:P-loop containing nucleoside triphosphate hydrolase protein n=1 Tax=Microthyrium microscopicum TaxID=703497 RepID=A0A6A6UPT6_9PEZI|nr:P-loop containing nucleoside triphosphate hydrolase protein [Microthyrium microscopicum]